MAEYDLTRTVAEYLDRHLVFPLLEFVGNLDIYQKDEILKVKLDTLSKTNMVDFAGEIYKKLYNSDNIPPEMIAKRESVLARMTQLKSECGILVNEELLSKLKAEKVFTPQHLAENYQVTPEQIDSLCKYAKFQFECGNYSATADYLSVFRALNTNPEKNFSALWGKFASEILMQNWESAFDDMNRLKELIDSKNFSTPLKQLQQRAWLIHWSLFVFFNHPKGRNGIIDLCLSERYLNAIQTTCPHILRYLTTAVITNKRRRNVLKDLVKVLQQESYSYRDPITEFLEGLYVNFDFEEAQRKLHECDQVLVKDFFFGSLPG